MFIKKQRLTVVQKEEKMRLRTASELILRDKIFSKMDPTVKYVFLSKGNIAEFSYIDNGTRKDIICIPTQTACRLGCRFCFLSDCDLEVRNFSVDEIAVPIGYVIRDMNLVNRPKRSDILLISVMGCGEPLLNLTNTMEACLAIKKEWSPVYRVVRFGLASLIPSMQRMMDLIERVRAEQLQMKFHLSLHSPNQEVRQKLMPAASPVRESIFLTELFMQRTGNSAEIHYALIDGVNDRDQDIAELGALLNGRNLPVKFLAYNEKPETDMKRSVRVSQFRQALEEQGIATEFYIPPGADVGSSCGQFLMEYYKQYNGKRKQG